MGAEAAAPEAAIERLTPGLDEGPGRRGRIGLLALSSDHVTEREVARVLPADEVALYVSRVANADTVTLATLRAMKEELSRAARLILPAGRIDVLAFSCTSGTMAIGEAEVFARLSEGRPEVLCTTPITAALAAFQRLGLRSVAILTPYIGEINEHIRQYLRERGVTAASFGSFALERDSEIGRVTPESVREAALALDRPEADGVFISCTGMRAVTVIADLEAALGKPVVTSNQAMAWHALRLAGYHEPVAGFGRLLET